ncbi:MAG TPA: RusA family crossover junction endodeoxyribonuclease [Planctomycetota bacterium]|nr:RusA family crossover junction endodeoxyribonuclease [Planctomycetota bacterium]
MEPQLQHHNVSFFVPGIPRPGGSKKGIYNPKSNSVMLLKAGGQNEVNWRNAVSGAALKAMGDRPPMQGPVRLDITFYMPRPKYHYYKTKARNGELRDDAPGWHTKTPDRGKLLRSTEDAMTGIVYRDDAQVCAGELFKLYGDRLGALITATPLDEAELWNVAGEPLKQGDPLCRGHGGLLYRMRNQDEKATA